ncbi:MAG TPA: hypothetical protein VK638_33145 [Edaphobacter sp.]|nr:hypothetical protein [Edaphobacter sp.]
MKPDDKAQPTGINFWVQGIVAQRDGQPYVQMANGERMIGQFTVAEARSIAQDLIVCASYAEADAMLHGFFKKMDLPIQALSALMMEFRDLRHEQEMKKVEKSHSDPDTGEQME